MYRRDYIKRENLFPPIFLPSSIATSFRGFRGCHRWKIPLFKIRNCRFSAPNLKKGERRLLKLSRGNFFQCGWTESVGVVVKIFSYTIRPDLFISFLFYFCLLFIIFFYPTFPRGYDMNRLWIVTAFRRTNWGCK